MASGATPPATVRVAVRMRDLSTKEREQREKQAWQSDPALNRIWMDDAFVDKARRAAPDFELDHVFTGPDTSEVYRLFASRVVWAAMEGYHGTVFAYGQTNSGKTYTMLGDEVARGIIPRAVDDVFRYIKQASDREFLLRVSYMEIYNETINDLLVPTQRNLQIHESKQHGIYVSPLSEELVRTPADVLEVIKRGQRNRHVSATDFNEYSSRSHTIFQLTIESNERVPGSPKKGSGTSTPVDGGKVKLSHLNLIDLAGSEKSTSNIDRQKEGAFINKSLLTLGTVIAKLSEGKPGHIPFRDSKLTRILQTSLSGKAYVAVIATISPSNQNLEESHNTLKFASRARNIALDAKQNEVEDDKALLKRYRTELADLRSQLADVNQKLYAIESQKTSLEDDEVNKLKIEKKKMEEELRDQSNLAFRLREDISNLTSIILTSQTVATPAKQLSTLNLDLSQLSDESKAEISLKSPGFLDSPSSPVRPLALPFTNKPGVLRDENDSSTATSLFQRKEMANKEHTLDRITSLLSAAEKTRGYNGDLLKSDLIGRLERLLMAGVSDQVAVSHLDELYDTIGELEAQGRSDRASLAQLQQQLSSAQLEIFNLRFQLVNVKQL